VVTITGLGSEYGKSKVHNEERFQEIPERNCSCSSRLHSSHLSGNLHLLDNPEIFCMVDCSSWGHRSPCIMVVSHILLL